MTGLPLDVPKLMFIAAVVPFYLFILSSDTVRSAPLFAIVPLAIMPHDIQYQALVWLGYDHRGLVASGPAAGAAPRLAPGAGGVRAHDRCLAGHRQLRPGLGAVLPGPVLRHGAGAAGRGRGARFC